MPTILLIDDDPQVQMFLAVALRWVGNHVLTTESGKLALCLTSDGGSDSGGPFDAGHGRSGTDPTPSQDATCEQDYCDL